MTILLFIILSGTVKFGGKHFFYNDIKKIVILSDSAYLSTGDVYLEADSIVYLRKERKLFAFGNSTLIVGKDTLRSDSLIYDTENDRGVAFNGKTREKKGILWGKKIYKVSDSILHVEHGYFTTCELDTPHYAFYSPKMKILRDNMAIVSPLILEVHNLPLIAVPFWFFPIGEGRKSGLLTPRFGFNRYDGKFIRNLSYYLVINNYMDLTLGLDLIEKRGVRADLDFVYNRYKAFAGNLSFTAAHEWSTGRKRWSLFGNHQGYLGRRLTMKAQANLISDESYIRDYSEEKTEWLEQELHSFVSITRNWRKVLFCLKADERRDLVKSSVSRIVPGFSLNIFNLEMKGIRFSSNIYGERNTYMGEDSTSEINSASMNGNFSTDFMFLRVIKVLPSLSFRSSYSRTPMVAKKAVSYSFSSNFSTVLYSLSKFGIGPIEKFRSTIKPTVNLSYTPENKTYNTKRREVISISLSNSYEAKTKKGEKISLLTLNLSTSCDRTKLKKRWSPLNLQAKLLPELPIKTRINANYDIEERELLGYEVYNSLKFKWSLPDTADTLRETWGISIGHSISWKRGGTVLERLSLTFSGNLTKNWSFSYTTNMDIRRGKVIDSRLSLDRDLHCWALSFNWRSFGQYWNYDFKIWIKALPEISLKRSLFEIFLPK